MIPNKMMLNINVLRPRMLNGIFSKIYGTGIITEDRNLGVPQFEVT